MATEQPFERIIFGKAEIAEELLLLFCGEFHPQPGNLRLNKVDTTSGAAFDVHLLSGATIGRLRIIGFPGNRVLVRSLDIGQTVDHPNNEHFFAFCEYFVRRCEEYGLLSKRSRFTSSGMVETAARQLAAADTPEGFASIGNVCRAALISLGRELFEDAMLAQGEEKPKLDAAAPRLKAVARFHWGGRSKNQLDGIKKLIDGTWDIAAAFLHRQHATREEADITVIQTAALFDVFSLLLP
jgi:hypothetical protein